MPFKPGQPPGIQEGWDLHPSPLTASSVPLVLETHCVCGGGGVGVGVGVFLVLRKHNYFSTESLFLGSTCCHPMKRTFIYIMELCINIYR